MISPGNPLRKVARFLSKVVFTVGTPLRGDKAAGIALAKLMTNNPIEGWDVVDGGASPQSDIASVRRLSPEFLLLVDAADMGLRPGDIRFLSDEEVVSEYLVTNQTLPIVYLLDQLSAICPQLYYLGIQPATTDHFSSLSSPVRAAVDTACSPKRATSAPRFPSCPTLTTTTSTTRASPPSIPFGPLS